MCGVRFDPRKINRPRLIVSSNETDREMAEAQERYSAQQWRDFNNLLATLIRFIQGFRNRPDSIQHTRIQACVTLLKHYYRP